MGAPAIARDGTYAALLARIAKLDALVLDDFLIAALRHRAPRPARSTRGSVRHLIDRRHVTGTDPKLARNAGRPYVRQRDLRLAGPRLGRQGPSGRQKNGL